MTPKVKIEIALLPPSLEGLRMVQLSDMHLGTGPKTEQIKKMVDQALALNPDLIALTGDIIDGMISEMKSELLELGRLHAPHGVYFVLGNHECYWKPLEAIETMKQLGFITLLNEGIKKDINGESIYIAGVNDPAFSHFGGEAPIVPTPPAEAAFKLALMHQPQFAHQVSEKGYHLQLSGHTHGGQFFPWNLFVRKMYSIHAGLGTIGTMKIYVNQGSGYWGPPIRLGTDGEITELILTRQTIKN